MTYNIAGAQSVYQTGILTLQVHIVKLESLFNENLRSWIIFDDYEAFSSNSHTMLGTSECFLIAHKESAYASFFFLLVEKDQNGNYYRKGVGKTFKHKWDSANPIQKIIRLG